MTARDCIDRAVEAGEVDAGRAGEAKTLLDELEAERLDALGDVGAAIAAKRDALARLKFEQIQSRRRTLMQAAAQQKTLQQVRIAADRNDVDLGTAAHMKIETMGNATPGFRGAENERQVLLKQVHGILADVAGRFRPDVLGRTRDRATLLDVGRELFGESTGNVPARELAASWREASEFLRKAFNAAGGSIPKLEDWGLPQWHDAVKVGRVTVDQWRDAIRPRLDRSRMIDNATGQPMSDARLDLLLADTYESIRTEGWSRVEPSGQAKGKSIAARRADHRFLKFNSYDDWLAYQDEFGGGDAFTAMMGYVDGMARDIAAMRALGPNPPATVRFLQDTIIKEAKVSGGPDKLKVENRASARAQQLKTLYDHYIGSANAPVDGRVARALATTRGLLTAAQLGSAALSAVSDINFGRLAAAYNGIPQFRVMRRQLKLLNPVNAEDRRLAARLGLVADTWTNVSAAQVRFIGDVVPVEWSRRITDGVLRASGLSAWTDAGRQAFGLEFMGFLADNAGKSHNTLPRALKNSFERYSIAPEDWEILRKTDLYEQDKGGFLRPDDVRVRADLDAGRANELAVKLLDMINTETQFAVPSTSLRGRAAIMGDARPGTIAGELLRSTLMYKNFAITMYYTHIQRAIGQASLADKLGYTANLIVGATLMGALSIQLKEISKGKDPRPMNSGNFLVAAMAQGGGLGIFGDFVFADVNRFGFGLEQTVAGPVVNLGTDLSKLTVGNLRELAQGKDTKVAQEAGRFVGRYAPGTSLWYARAALQNGIIDNLVELADPGVTARWKKSAGRAQKNYGNEFYWPRGSLTPERAPDLTNIVQ